MKTKSLEEKYKRLSRDMDIVIRAFTAETKEMEIVQMLSELLVKFNDASENEVCSSIRFENKIRADLIAAILKQISKH